MGTCICPWVCLCDSRPLAPTPTDAPSFLHAAPMAAWPLRSFRCSENMAAITTCWCTCELGLGSTTSTSLLYLSSFPEIATIRLAGESAGALQTWITSWLRLRGEAQGSAHSGDISSRDGGPTQQVDHGVTNKKGKYRCPTAWTGTVDHAKGEARRAGR